MLRFLKTPSDLTFPKIVGFTTILIILLTSCGNPEEQKPGEKTYYDVKDFVSGQVESLTFLTPVVNKKLVFDGKSELLSTKNINWKKELDLFSQADLNKPAYKQSYTVAHADSLSYEYQLKPGESLPVQWLKIQIDSASGNPASIHALLLSKNKLYESQKDVELTCAGHNGKWIVKSYRIKGFQQLMILEPRQFDITGIVQF